MTCCHYVILRTYFDKLIEFSSNMKCSGVLKARNLEELKATNHDAIGNSRGTILVPDCKFGSTYFNVTRLLEVCHHYEERSRRLLGFA